MYEYDTFYRSRERYPAAAAAVVSTAEHNNKHKPENFGRYSKCG